MEDIDEELVNPTDKRIFAISSAFHRGYSVDKVWQITNIDKWSLTKLQHIFNMEQCLSYVSFFVVHCVFERGRSGVKGRVHEERAACIPDA